MPPASFAERACVDLPFSLYLGWITTATLANLAAAAGCAVAIVVTAVSLVGGRRYGRT